MLNNENVDHKIIDGKSPSIPEYVIHIMLLTNHIGQHAIIFLAFKKIPAKETAAAAYPSINNHSITSFS